MKVIVIGAGAAGLMASIKASENGHQVILLDSNEKCGRKLYITGKGRCNVTNNVAPNEFIKNIVTNPKFMYSAINNFTPSDTIDFFNDRGVELVTERGNRVFPKSYKASDIIDCLYNECKKNGVRIVFSSKVTKVEKKNDLFYVNTTKLMYTCDKLIIATGGASYSTTGSTGDGYYFAKLFNHKVTKLYPALCPIMIKNNFPKTFNNLELKNVSLTCVTERFKKTLFGEMTFVDNGISGPIVLTMSSLINKEVVKELSIDFKPALTHEKLDERLLKDFLERRNESLNSVMRGLLPQVLINVFLNKIKVDGTKKVNEITKNERLLILNNLKKFDLSFEKLDTIEHSIVTSGGVDVSEINPRTMESKLVSGLYFVGEVLDIDCFTGGFNIQCALSMGYIAGNNI